MPHPKQLSRAEILRAARRFSWTRKMPKWTVVVEGRELPARPLVLEAAGAAPNDSTNSHQAVAILEELGFQTRYRRAGETVKEPDSEMDKPTDVAALLRMAKRIADQIPPAERRKIPRDLSINLDHYLYGHPKKDE